MSNVTLPAADGTLERYTLGQGDPVHAQAAGSPGSRVVYAAAHVVSDPRADVDPTGGVAIDWDATLAFRRHLWSLGLGVAEAMDTAQRGMGLDWAAVRELISRSVAEARAVGGDIVCGVATDQLSDGEHTLEQISAAYLEQLAFVEDLGGRAVVMASRDLAATARSAEDYLEVYGSVLSQASDPVTLHWLGEMFDPALTGYWGHAEAKSASDVVVALCTEHASKVEGVKISMLDEELEVGFRRRLPSGVRCFTGDDFNYPTLIQGDDHGHSDALLGILDPIAVVAREALAALDAGDTDGYQRLLAPTVPLSRHIFAEPTMHYKTGIVFLAYLAGHQRHFRMVGGRESSRSTPHLGQLLRLADAAGLLGDPDVAAARARPVFEAAGIEQ